MNGDRIERRLGKRLAKAMLKVEQQADPTFALQSRRFMADQVVIGKAKVESGSYPTLQQWSEENVNAKKTTWTFQIGGLTDPGGDTQARVPSTYWQTYDPAIYVTAHNLQGYHYVPENEYVALWRWENAWYFEHVMPPMIYGTLDSLINSSTSALMTVLTSGGFGGTSGKCLVHLNLTIGVNLLASTQCYCSLMKGAGSSLRYEVVAVGQCPTVAPEEEE